MNHDKFNDSLNKLLAEGRVSHVFEVLRNKCNASMPAHPELGNVLSGLSRAEDTYSHLRRFLISGGSDPDRLKILSDIKEQVRDLARRYLFIVNEERFDPFFSEFRLQKIRNVGIAELMEELDKTEFRISMASETGADASSFIRKKEGLVDSLFRKIWSLPPWATEDHKTLERILTEGNADFTLLSQVISALLLGLLKFNDPAKFLLLLKAYDSAPNERIAARALTAVVLTLGRWGDSALSTPAVREAVQALEDSLLTYSRVRDIVMTLIRTRDTDRVSREISEAFDSTMKEITPEMLDKLRRDGLSADVSETGLNPEWEKLLQNKEIEDRMKAINDMQIEGMDVMMQTFSRLKTFPFFQSVSNWFLPFSATHSAVAPLFDSFDPEGFSVMADATDMCASDRFSFALGIMQMPEDRRGMLSLHLGSQLEALRDMMKDRENVRRKPEFATEALVFARDLYRFAKLFPRKKDFYDPFEAPIDFLRLPLLGPLLEGDDIILTSADFYFRHGYYPQALSLYEKIDSADRGLYEKMGFCYQMQGDFASALANYEKADLFSSDVDPSSSWLLKKLAFTNKALGNYDSAAEYYSRLLERQPGDPSLEFHLATMLLRNGEVNKAKDLVSKVHYLNPEHKHASRIYSRLKGHEAFIEGRYSDALSLYLEARGEQPMADYRRDLTAELRQLAPQADLVSLQILLDSGD